MATITITGNGHNSADTLYKIHQGNCSFKKDTATFHSQVKLMQEALTSICIRFRLFIIKDFYHLLRPVIQALEIHLNTLLVSNEIIRERLIIRELNSKRLV